MADLLPGRVGDQYREPRFSSEVEPFVYGLLKTKTHALDAKVFALNGMPDHGHLVFSVHPKVAPAAFLGSVKGYSSNRINQAGLLDRRASRGAAVAYPLRNVHGWEIVYKILVPPLG